MRVICRYKICRFLSEKSCSYLIINSVLQAILPITDLIDKDGEPTNGPLQLLERFVHFDSLSLTAPRQLLIIESDDALIDLNDSFSQQSQVDQLAHERLSPFQSVVKYDDKEKELKIELRLGMIDLRGLNLRGLKLQQALHHLREITCCASSSDSARKVLM